MWSVIPLFVILSIAHARQLEAKPEPVVSISERGIVADVFSGIIEDLSRTIVEAGYDPYKLDVAESEYSLPVPVLFNYHAYVKDVSCIGLSDIIIERVNYATLTSRLTFELTIPTISFSVGDTAAEVTLFGTLFEGKASGKIEIHNLRVTGVARVTLGVITGVSVRSLSLNFDLGTVEPDLQLKIQEYELTDELNNFVRNGIPTMFDEYREEVNLLLETIVWGVINA